MMNKDELQHEILSIFGRVVAGDGSRRAITPEVAPRTELKLDSLAMVGVVYLIEEQLEIDLLDRADQLAAAATIRQVVDVVFRAYEDQHRGGR